MSTEVAVEVGRRQVQFRNTNGLVYNDDWEIGPEDGLHRRGWLDAWSRDQDGRPQADHGVPRFGRQYTRIADAERVRRWMQQTSASIKGTVRAE